MSIKNKFLKKNLMIKAHLNTLLDIMIMMNHYNGPLCIKLPQMIEYVRCFDNNKTMFFKVIYDNL